MENKRELPIRKRNRLKGYDYSSAGAYFLTVCTHNRKEILSDIVINEVYVDRTIQSVGAIHESPACRPEYFYEASESRLRPYGKIVEDIINEIPVKYDVIMSDYVIMPNHIHLVIFIDERRAIRESPLQKRSLISKIMGYLKTSATKKIHEFSPGAVIWQRNYHDHIIRCDEEYLKIAEYIYGNPGKWEEDCFYPHERTPHDI